jgi:hypothetical protein
MTQKVLFICGSRNHTTQMHQIARAMPEVDAWFTPYYVDGYLRLLRWLRLIEITVAGYQHSRRCLEYLAAHDLAVDVGGRRGDYDLVLTPCDLIIPRNLHDRPVVHVQEGMMDPLNRWHRLWRRLPFLPRWPGSTALTGLSGQYDRFCVASEGFRQQYVARGVPAERMVVTGIPNFDDCERYRDNRFPGRGYLLVCTSDIRETYEPDDRRGFLRWVRELAAGREIVFKLHPNEKVARATREIREECPGAAVFTTGSAEEMTANASALVVQRSSVAFVGLALGKEVYSSHFDVEELRRLLPIQNGATSARAIADVCRAVLRGEGLRPALRERRRGLLPAAV